MSTRHPTRRRFALSAGALGAAALLPYSVSAAARYAQIVLAKHPVAYWPLSERHGVVAADASGGGHDGTFHGEPGWASRVRFATRRMGPSA